jgi:BASS family bile acid:Na+ symporter
VEESALTSIGLPIALAVIMVGIGLALTVEDFRREGRAPRAMTVGTLAQLVAVPALAFALIAVMYLDPAVAVGLVIVAACPGGTTSNLVTYLARANVALSIVLTVLASIATIVTLPLLAGIALDRFAGGGSLSVPLGESMLTLFGVVLVPTFVGMTIRARAPRVADRLERGVAAIGGVVLAALIVGIALSTEDLVGLLAQAGPAVIALNLGAIAIGWATGRLSGLAPADRLTVAVELSIKNSTLGILLAELVGDFTYAVPAAVYALVMYATAIVLVGVGRRTLGVDADLLGVSRAG